MKYSSNERGAVSVLAIVLVLVVVAAAGFAVYNVSKARKTDTQSVNTSRSPASSPVSSTSPAATPANVFVVKELSIQFTVSNDIKDLVYSVRTSNGVTSADFSTASLVAADRNADGKYCTAEAEAPLGSISLSSSTTNGAVKTIGNQSLVYATLSQPALKIAR